MAITRTVRIRTKPLGRSPESTDIPSRFIDGAHWALEIVGDSGSILAELQVQAGVLSTLNIRPDRTYADFFPPDKVAKQLRDDFVGSTTLSDPQIREIAETIMSDQRLYNPISNSCQNFVVRLAIAIITEPTEGLRKRVQIDHEQKIDRQTIVTRIMATGVSGMVIEGAKAAGKTYEKVGKIITQFVWGG